MEKTKTVAKIFLKIYKKINNRFDNNYFNFELTVFMENNNKK